MLLKTNGMQVSPTELESIFLKHNAVKEVAVIGKPDEISGQLPTAFVVIKDQYKNDIDCNELLEFVNSNHISIFICFYEFTADFANLS